MSSRSAARDRLKLVLRDRRPEVEAIQRSIARLPFDSFPFWLATTSSHTHSWDPDAPPNDEWYNPQRKRGRVVISDPDAAEHVHLLIGGISFYRVRESRPQAPEKIMRRSVVWSLGRAVVRLDGELLVQGQVLEGGLAMAADGEGEEPEQVKYEGDHEP